MRIMQNSPPSLKDVHMSNTLRIILILICALLIGAVSAKAQQTCPIDMVCLTPQAARAALEAGDKAKALQIQLDATEKALADTKQLLTEMKVNFAQASGENTILKQEAVRNAALIELFAKMVRPKKVGINIF